MKYLYITLFTLISQLIYSQDDNDFKTIFGGRETGGYGSFSFGYSPIDTTHAFVFNARGGVILGHAFSMGIAGSGFISEYKYDQNLDLNGSLSGGYGGVYLELILAGKSPVHLSIPCVFGIGGAAYSTWINEGTDYQPENTIEDISTFLVIEPGVELEFNMSKYFRMAGFFSYRYTTDLDISSVNTSGSMVRLVNPKALNSYSAGIIFKFGKF